ncbi:Uncharacterised protein [uncultured archaeon]|nr:Uncharacterised protein [uncultured archaeon]
MEASTLKSNVALSECPKCPRYLEPRFCEFAIVEYEATRSEEVTMRDCMKLLLPNSSPETSNPSNNNEKQPTATGQNNNVAFSSNHKDRILEFLGDHPEEEFNATSISKLLGIPYNIVTATLSKLYKAGKIWKPHHGFYAIDCTLDKHQIRKIEKTIEVGVHGASIAIYKSMLSNDITLLKNFELFLPTVGPKATSLDSFKSNQQQPEATISDSSNPNKENGKIREKVLEFIPGQRVTITEYSDKFMIVIKASENALTLKEFLWMYEFLKTLFGEAVSKAELTKFDLNGDIPVSLSPNQLILGDVASTCLAVYGKGNKTRVELRNFHPDGNLNLGGFVPLLLGILQAANKGLATSKPESDYTKATDSNQKQLTPESNLGESEPPPIQTREKGAREDIAYA